MKNYLLLLLALNIHQSSASCFGKDAHFKSTDQPVVSQVSRTDPGQVLVSWDKIIKRPECVDRYNVWVWPEGSERTAGTKVLVEEKEKDGKTVVTSKKVSVEPCLNYRFLVELEEVDSMTGLNQERTGEQVFKTASTSSSTSGLTDPSQYEISYHWDGRKVDLGRADIKFRKSLLTNPNCLDYIQVTGSEARVTTGPRLPGGRSVPSSRGEALQYLSMSQPQVTVGKASTLPARISYSDVTRGSRPVSPTSSSMTYPAPQFAYTMTRPSGGQKRTVSPVKLTPPFLNSSILLTVPVKDCAQFNFDLKFVGGGRDVANVKNLELPALADQPGFVPPPVTSVLTVSYNTAGKPLYGVKSSSGVSAACLPAYFEAYDAYSQRLENEIGWQGAKREEINQLVRSSENELSRSQEELLKSLGCQCTSSSVNLTTTDQKILKKTEANQLGQYQFQGMYKESPYYMKRVDGTKPFSVYLYQDSGSKQWRFATDLGGKKDLFFASVEKSVAKCPGDSTADGNWQAATGTFGRFKKNANVKVVCNRI